jgi:hypothetical protein
MGDRVMITRSIGLAAFALLLCALAVRPAAAQATCAEATATSTVKDAYKFVPVQNAATPANGAPAAQPAPPVEKIRTVQLKDTIVVEVDNLAKLYDKACQNKNIVLYLDGLPLKSLTPYPPTDPAGGKLHFVLRRSENSRTAWTAILGAPFSKDPDVEVSVGFEDQFPLKPTGSRLPTLALDRVPIKWFCVWGLIFVVALAVFGWCVKRTNIIRDGSPLTRQQQDGTYSLSKSQGAVWFFAIVAAYLLIGMVTGDWASSINSTALILLGIGAGTVLGSAAIDMSKENSDQQRAAADLARTTLDRLEATDIPAKKAEIADPANSARKEQLNGELLRLTAERDKQRSAYRKLTHESENFITDILSDANGVNFHRFQMAVWTLLLGFIFIKEVYENLAMPAFDQTLMGLLGLSAGTYLGLKIPEPTVPK